MKSGNFGFQLSKVLKSKGLSRSEFGRQVGFNKTTVWLYVHGKRDPSLDSLLRMLKVLDMSLEELFRFET